MERIVDRAGRSWQVRTRRFGQRWSLIIYGVSFTEVVTRQIQARDHSVLKQESAAFCTPLVGRMHYNVVNAHGQDIPRRKRQLTRHLQR